MPFPISGIHKTVECHVVLGLLAEPTEKKKPYVARAAQSPIQAKHIHSLVRPLLRFFRFSIHIYKYRPIEATTGQRHSSKMLRYMIKVIQN